MKTNKLFYILILFVLAQINTYSQVYDSSDLYFEEAKKDISQQNYAKAAKMSWRGLQLSPNDLDLKTLLGKANLEMGKYDTARWVLREVYERNRKNIDVLEYLVKIEHITKRYSDAICFVNELLEITPYSRGWWRRKIVIYEEMGNLEEADRARERIYQIYPDDTEIREAYNYSKLRHAGVALDGKNFNKSNTIYKNIIDSDPLNRDAYLGIIKNELLKGNPEAALQYTNRSLKQIPFDADLLKKKVGLLEDLGRYAEAISYIKELEREKNKIDAATYNDLKNRTLPYLMQQSASFNEYNDAYEVNKKLAEAGGNSIAQDYVISNALGKTYDVDAEYFIKRALKRSPNNKKLRIQLQELYKPIKDRDRYEKEVIINHEKYPNDADVTFAYNTIMYRRGKEYFENRQFDLALPIFVDLATYADFTKEAELQVFGILLEQEKYDEAEDQIDKLIGLDAQNPNYLLKKSTLYQKMELFDDALEITRGLEQQFPLNQTYPSLYVDQIEAYATFLVREQRYSQALTVIEDGLTRENNNKRLLEIAINASSALPDYPRGINYSKSALSFYPNNKNFKLKLSNLLAQNKEYDEAISVLDSLKTVYKYDRKIKNSLAEVLWFRAKDKEERGLIDEAISDYNVSDTLNPTEDFSRQRMINLYISNKPNDETLDVINEKIKKYPNDTFLKYKKGLVYELMKEYDSAYFYQKFRKIDDPIERQAWNDQLETLGAKQLKNSLSVTYLKASSDSVAFNTSLASANYRRIEGKNTYGADVNYAARRSGVGVQAGVNFSKIITETLYADVGILLGSKFFPKFKIYGNAYKEVFKKYEAHVGLSLTRLQSDQNYFTLKLGASRSWEDIWVNAQLSLMNGGASFFERDPNSGTIILVNGEPVTYSENFFYTNLMVQTRINVNPRKDYFSVVVSGGSAPFDQQLEFQQNTFLNFSNIMVGAGYKYHMTPRTSILINGTWINFQSNQTTQLQIINGVPTTVITDAFYTNQYNLGVTFTTQF